MPQIILGEDIAQVEIFQGNVIIHKNNGETVEIMASTDQYNDLVLDVTTYRRD